MKSEHLNALLSSKRGSKSSSKSVTPCREARDQSVFDHTSADIYRADFAPSNDPPVRTIFKQAEARDKFRVRIVDRP
jgi:hypothetical protein